ncbi:MAG: carbamoyl phosphate synthase small subunit [Firmicutes bacterium]|nr:carbamoyl phosphate synthase small subunit [Bacillota bacterium]
MKKGFLVLQNGTVFEGKAFGADKEVVGEIVFTTAMAGYLETLTDPSYYGQIVLQTFPLIGNYGVIEQDFESDRVWPRGYIVKYPCFAPSNFRSEYDLDTLLKKHGVTGLADIDTRALAKIIRQEGAMNGKIMFKKPTAKDRKEIAEYKVLDAVANVSKKDISRIEQPLEQKQEIAQDLLDAMRVKSADGTAAEVAKTEVKTDKDLRIALLDTGSKRAIEMEMIKRGAEVKRFAYNASADEILAYNPTGILLSNGPGDPAEKANAPIIETIKKLVKSNITIFGICLGHQFLAMANGLKSRKLKFGHRSANQPVKDLKSGKVYITSQNHGYEVISKGKSWLVNVNDGTCEGLDFGNSFSVQFHPEACGGPLDTTFLFDKFVDRIKASQKTKSTNGGVR